MSGIRPGDVIAGKFRVERVLGEGGMGYVVAATHLQLSQTVALKFIRDEVCTPEYKRRFLREARNTVRLKSKHVSRVLDVGSLDGGAPYMVMEYLEGTDLSNLLHKRGPLPPAEVCEYVIQACEALFEAHSHGIVHRDLKPANLFLTHGTSGEAVVKVLDFGVSKVLDMEMSDDTNPGGRPRGLSHADSVVTKATDLLGSPSYMAPEQIVSARNADARSDIWSLGIILFRLLSGKAPFQASALGELIQAVTLGPIPDLRALKPDLPAGLEHVVMRCLDRDRARRPDAGELARLLAPFAGPVATPSLERIAILGSALVAATPLSQPSGPAFAPSGGAWASGAPPRSTVPPPPRDVSRGAALAAMAIAILVVGAGAFFLALRLKAAEHLPQTSRPEPSPVAVTEPPRTDVQPLDTIRPPPTGIAAAPPPTGIAAAPPPTGVPAAPTPSESGSSGTKVGPKRRRPVEGPAAPQPTSEIPSTRE